MTTTPPTTALIIDDHADIRLLIRQLIELAGDGVAVIAEAADGLAAIEVLHQLDVDVPTVVVTDWMMPGLDGIETAVRIRADRPNVRVILCSAYGDPHMERAAMAAGIDLVIAKDDIASIPGRIVELVAA